MKKIFLIIGAAVIGSIPAYSQLSAGSQGLTVKPGTQLSYGGLVLTPTATFQMDTTQLTVSSTPVSANGTSIKRVFNFSPAVNYTGIIGIRYSGGDLNGNNEDSLAISLFDGTALRPKVSENEGGNNYFVYSDTLTNVSLNNVTANTPQPGTIYKSAASVAAMTTTYGTASAADSFLVAGQNIMDSLTVKAPAGFEVSLNGTSYASAVALPGDGGPLDTAKVYVRIAGTTNVGSPAGYVVLSSATSLGEPADSVQIASSTVSAKLLTINGVTVTPKVYNGDTLATASGTAGLTGIVNDDTVSVNATNAVLVFGNKNVGNNKSVYGTGYVLTGADSANYKLADTLALTGNITRATATVVASNRDKCYINAINGVADTANFTVTGLATGEGIASVNFSSTGFPANTNSGTYAIQVSNAIGKPGTDTANYTISYTPGTLTVLNSINATITTAANVQLCSGNPGSIAINTTGNAPLTGRFRILNQMTNAVDTVTVQINNSGQSAPLIPASYLQNNGISPINYKVSWASLQENGSSCYAGAPQLTGEVIITVFPVPVLDATASQNPICSGSPLTISVSNTNAVGGTYNILTKYNGAQGGNIPVNGITNRQYTAGPLNESLSLSDTATVPVNVRYIFTPITTNTSYSCIGLNDTLNVVINPKPQFKFEVNNEVLAANGTDTICQAASTKFAITGATNGHTYSIKHTWVDGNNTTQSNNNYASGVIVDGGVSNTFISGGNSVNPAINPGNEPTAGTYEITVSDTAFSGCSTVRTFHIYVEPKPEFTFAVNGDVMAIGGTDTICQATSTTFTIGNATNGHLFSVKHTWIDGNDSVKVNEDYASGTISNGGLSNTFISGGNSVNPAVNPANEPTAGTYEITLTNPVTGCKTTRSFNVYVQPKPEFSFAVNGETMNIGATDTICQAASTTFAIENATNGHTYAIKHIWRDGNDSLQVNNSYASGTIANGGVSTTFISGGNSVNPAVNPGNEPTAGAYEITMTNPVTGCQTIRTFNVYVQPKPEFTFSVNGDVVAINGTDTICQAAPTVFAIANATDGHTFSVKHTWIDGNSNTQTNDTFATGTVSNGGFVHNFTSGGNSVNPSVNPSSEPTAGAYEITMTNPVTGCKTTRTFNVYVNPKPMDEFQANGIAVENGDTVTSCLGESVALGVSGNASHSYVLSQKVASVYVDVATGQVNDSAYTFMAAAENAGDYRLTLTDDNTGCTSEFNYYVNVIDQRIFTVAPDSIVQGNDLGQCGAEVTYNIETEGLGTATYTHQFTGATVTTGFEPGLGSGSVFNKGTTTVTVRVANGICDPRDTTFTVIVNDTEAPTITYSGGNLSHAANNTSCTYKVATTAPVINDNCGTNGLALTYALTGATVASGTGNLDTFAFNVGITTVTYTVKDSADNIDTVSYTVNVTSSAPAVSLVGQPVAAACYGSNTGSFTFHYNNSVSGMTVVKIRSMASGNIIYTSNNPISIFTGTQSNLAAGTYTLYATNVHGCTDSISVVIGQPAAPLALGSGLTSTNVVCGTPNSGTLTFGASGGTAPYTVAVTGPNLSPTPNSNFVAGTSFDGYQLTGLGAGTYTVSIVDSHNCTISQSVTIVAQAAAIAASVSAPGVPFCMGDAAPNVTFTASGGTAPYTFTYTLDGTSHTVTTTGSNSTVTVAQPTTAAGNFTYVLTGVSDANGVPCATNITQGQGAAVVTVNDCSGPDLVPVVLMPATSYSSTSVNRTLIINLANVGTGASHGLVSVTVLKPTPGFTYAAPNLPANWTVTDNGSTLTFETMNVIGSNATVTLTGTLSQTPGANAVGVYTMTTYVNNGAGGDTNSTNNVKFTTITLTP